MENNRAFSELDEVEEDQDSDRKAVLITDGMYFEDESNFILLYKVTSR